MTSSKRLTLASILLLCSLSAMACFEGKIETVKLNDYKRNPNRLMNGVFYSLPRTIVQVDVPVVRIDKTPGAYARFAKCFFPEDDAITAKTFSFGIDNSNIRFGTQAIPDPQEVYLIKTTGGKFETRSLEMALTESGVFIKGKGETKNEAIDVLTTTAKNIVALGSKFINPAALDGGGGERKQPAHVMRCQTTYATPAATKADFDAALEVYNNIRDLQGMREQLLAGSDSSADTLKLKLSELDGTIKGYRDKYFLGVTSKATWPLSFRFNPQNPNAMYAQLFQLDPAHGVCQIIASQGIQFNPSFREGPCNGKPIWIALELGDNGENNSGGIMLAQAINDAQLNDGGKRGFYYRVPGRAMARLYEGSNFQYQQFQYEYYQNHSAANYSLASATERSRAMMSVAQLGITVSLPASTGGRRTKYDLELYENTGGMKNFIMGSDALLQQSNVDVVTSSVSNVLDAKRARNEANAPPSELDTLEQKRKILEERKKIKDLEKELGTSPEN